MFTVKLHSTADSSVTALERTYLAHFHTSIALIEVSIYISQWYTLSGASGFGIAPDTGLQYIGRLLSSTLIVWATVVIAIGAYRFFKMQECMLKGARIKAGGWELCLEGFGIAVVSKVPLYTLPIDRPTDFSR